MTEQAEENTDIGALPTKDETPTQEAEAVKDAPGNESGNAPDAPDEEGNTKVSP